MVNIAYQDTYACSDSEFPMKGLSMDLVIELACDDVPDAATRRHGAALLRVLADRMEHGKGTLIDLAPGEEKPGQNQAEADTWTIPSDLHMKSVKGGHRFLLAAAALLEKGPAPTLAEIAAKAKMSMPPLYRYLDSTDGTGAYLAPLISITKKGRAQVIDLTPLGRIIASRIRAGSLPS